METPTLHIIQHKKRGLSTKGNWNASLIFFGFSYTKYMNHQPWENRVLRFVVSYLPVCLFIWNLIFTPLGIFCFIFFLLFIRIYYKYTEYTFIELLYPKYSENITRTQKIKNVFYCLLEFKIKVR